MNSAVLRTVPHRRGAVAFGMHLGTVRPRGQTRGPGTDARGGENRGCDATPPSHRSQHHSNRRCPSRWTPCSGSMFFVNSGFTTRIVQLKRAESDAVLPPRGDAGVPVSLLLAGAFRRLLGQPLRPAPRHAGLLSAAAARPPGDHPGRQALLPSLKRGPRRRPARHVMDGGFSGHGHLGREVCVPTLCVVWDPTFLDYSQDRR
jgi:hypothetical protein